MKVAVLGGGVIGITSAYFLAREGHEVTVLEGRSELAQDASGGNAGLIAPGHSFAWASPAAPRMLVRSLFGAATAIRVDPKHFSPALVRWGLRFLRECTTARARANTLAKFQLCAYSQRLTTEIAGAEKIDYAASGNGMFYLYDNPEQLEAGFARTRLLRDAGRDLRLIDAAECVSREPALAAAKDRIVGAVFGADDASGDSERFTLALAEVCRGLGVEIRTSANITRLSTDGDEIVAAETRSGPVRADTYVLALGVGSPAIAATAGQRLPVYPAKGYSATFPIRDGDECPTVGGVDENTLVAWSRLGDRLRVSSTAEFAGFDRSWKPENFTGIRETLRKLFPNAADYEAGSYRSCLRPMTPDGPPIIGRGRHRNLFYNTGHGHMGWTMAVGSGQVLADLVGGRTPAMPMDPMRVR